MTEIKNLKDEPELLPILASWHQHEWSHLNPGETLEHRIDRMQTYLDNNFIPSTFIAENKTLLGSASIVSCDMETMPELTPWLASVFVAPEYRNKGIGRKLVRHIMSQAKRAGIKTLYLFTEDQIGFYLALDWTINCTAHYHQQEVTIMQITLNDL
ncbi:MAG: GNAT family N-acetyltransferase [Gammaproteobacteria bacterium]|nr:GNAT family N-acetyltransferase [Gammaproteobacteria bacterium]